MVTIRSLVNNIPTDFPEDHPVFMFSLFQWNEQAKYSEWSSNPPCSGQEAWFERFIKEISRLATESGDFEIVYQGSPTSSILGNETWDLVALVKFTNIGTFRNTIGSDDYAPTTLEHCDAALKNWQSLFFSSPKSTRSSGNFGFRPRRFSLTRSPH